MDVRLFPLLDHGKHFVERSWLLPASFTAIISLILVVVDAPALYFYSLALYISLALYFFVHLMCHGRKRFWVAMVVAAVTCIMTSTRPILTVLLLPFRAYPFFSDATDVAALGLLGRFLFFFVAAGLAEEFIKIIPVLFCWFIATRTHGAFGRLFGVRTPLDGILLGAASGIGFSLTETMGQYVPHMIAHVSQNAGSGSGMYAGLTLMIPRLLGMLFGHMAYAGYFGYFVGLAALRVLPVWKVLLVGWLTAAFLHGLWDTFAGAPLGVFAEMPVACLAYACLAAAILEGRRMTRQIAEPTTPHVTLPVRTVAL